MFISRSKTPIFLTLFFLEKFGPDFCSKIEATYLLDLFRDRVRTAIYTATYVCLSFSFFAKALPSAVYMSPALPACCFALLGSFVMISSVGQNQLQWSPVAKNAPDFRPESPLDLCLCTLLMRQYEIFVGYA